MSIADECAAWEVAIPAEDEGGWCWCWWLLFDAVDMAADQTGTSQPMATQFKWKGLIGTDRLIQSAAFQENDARKSEREIKGIEQVLVPK